MKAWEIKELEELRQEQTPIYERVQIQLELPVPESPPPLPAPTDTFDYNCEVDFTI